jgi:hypothetical protein
MPRYSYREHYIFSCHLEYQKELLSSFLIPYICNDSSDDESSGDENDRNSSILLKRATYTLLEDSCYLFRSPTYRPNIRRSRQGEDVPCWLRIINGEIYNEEEFLKFFRVPRHMFLTLARLLKNCPSFSSDVKQRKHLSHKLHLLVTLKYFGSEGNASSFSHVKDGLGIGNGSVLNYIERTVTALLTLQKRSIFWPSAAER